MSLFLGNLSSHIHEDELERVFRRFGWCDVQLKDGYGFVIYEVPENAERALRSLRGKQICGENIAIDWSKKQPRPFQRFSRGRRPYEPYHGRNFREDENSERIRDPQYRRNLVMDRGRRPMFGQRGRRFDETAYNHEDVGNHREEKALDAKGKSLNEGDAVEPDTAENDRWGEPSNGSLERNGADREADFERYEPSHGVEKRDDIENRQIPGSDADNLKQQPICYICGIVGHKMRNCPRGDRSRRDRFGRFGRRDDDASFPARGERGLSRNGPDSRGRFSAGRDTLLSRPHSGDAKGSQSEKLRRLERRRESSPESSEDHLPRVRKESRGRKRGRHESGGSNKKRKKRSKRRSQSSSPHSDSAAGSSRSRSRSSRSASGVSSHSRSRSVSSRLHSESSSSKSVKDQIIIHYTDNNLPSFPKDAAEAADAIDASAMDEMLHVSGPESKQQFGDHLVGSELKGTGPNGASEDENVLTYPKMDAAALEEQHPGDASEDGNLFDFSMEEKERDLCMDLLDKVSYSSEKSLENLGEEDKAEEAQSHKLDLEIHGGYPDSRSSKMSFQEMCTVLRHYGLAAPDESSDPGSRSVGAYFGSARLWPWEMVYYRRLKKGPITTENYARRLAQNKKFGIVDKFIRSSSGWGDSEQDDI
ncbi:unnamed protein product [Spirodela intermedia]|uniref:Uncharacterized protein n=1 Tax=Spirodela intermedia TaxID=51605 RepID=A0A7I8J1A2_SPIIN|nr:unnamed protein product [Spirodela intermedia]CAA6663742.1 unnamed protein product [Spirodela intermedia]